MIPEYNLKLLPKNYKVKMYLTKENNSKKTTIRVKNLNKLTCVTYYFGEKIVKYLH